MKTLTDLCRKAAKKCANHLTAQQEQDKVSEIEELVSGNVKKRKTLQQMSELLLKKNSDLYLKHELMLDEERQRRMDLGTEFQAKMSEIQNELTKEKEQRAQQMEENAAIRKKIQDAISEYNQKEQNYQGKMKEHQGKMSSLESKFKQQIEGKIQTQINQAKDAKDKYDNAATAVEHLAT